MTKSHIWFNSTILCQNILSFYILFCDHLPNVNTSTCLIVLLRHIYQGLKKENLKDDAGDRFNSLKQKKKVLIRKIPRLRWSETNIAKYNMHTNETDDYKFIK